MLSVQVRFFRKITNNVITVWAGKISEINKLNVLEVIIK